MKIETIEALVATDHERAARMALSEMGAVLSSLQIGPGGDEDLLERLAAIIESLPANREEK